MSPLVPAGWANPDLFSIDIQGIQEAQAANIRDIAALQPENDFGRVLQFVTAGAMRYTIQITHVDTGALKSGHRMELDLQAARGEIFVDPAAIGPHGPPIYYADYEHARGGSHAFYDRTIAEFGPAILRQGVNMLARSIT